jgi:hypothetical protein
VAGNAVKNGEAPENAIEMYQWFDPGAMPLASFWLPDGSGYYLARSWTPTRGSKKGEMALRFWVWRNDQVTRQRFKSFADALAFIAQDSEGHGLDQDWERPQP